MVLGPELSVQVLHPAGHTGGPGSWVLNLVSRSYTRQDIRVVLCPVVLNSVSRSYTRQDIRVVLGPELIWMAFNSVSRSFPHWLTGRKTPAYLPTPLCCSPEHTDGLELTVRGSLPPPPPPPPPRRTYRYVPCPKPFDVLAGRPSVRIPQMFQATVSVFSVAAVCIGLSVWLGCRTHAQTSFLLTRAGTCDCEFTHCPALRPR